MILGSFFTKGLVVALLASLFASPASFAAKPKTAQPLKTAKAKPTATKTKESPEFLSPRYQLAHIDSYIDDHEKTYDIRTLDIDPFGLPQDPSKKPITPKITPKRFHKYKNIPPTPFADIIAALRVNAVMPHQQRFLIGSRSIRRGDKFPSVFRDKSITVQVLRVEGKKIDFLNTTTGETAALSLELLPPGMNRESGKANPPGLVRNDPAAPIEVQLDPPASSRASGALSRNR
jgi:hypothetical protein